MHSQLRALEPVDDIVTQNTPGLKIWEEMWGGMQCAYHIFAPGTDFTTLLKGHGLEHDLCGVEHWAYVLKGTVEVIYLDGTVEVCTAGDVLLLAGSAQLQVEGRRRDPPVQHRWRVGCASQDHRGDVREERSRAPSSPAFGRSERRGADLPRPDLPCPVIGADVLKRHCSESRFAEPLNTMNITPTLPADPGLGSRLLPEDLRQRTDRGADPHGHARSAGAGLRGDGGAAAGRRALRLHGAARALHDFRHRAHARGRSGRRGLPHDRDRRVAGRRSGKPGIPRGHDRHHPALRPPADRHGVAAAGVCRELRQPPGHVGLHPRLGRPDARRPVRVGSQHPGRRGHLAGQPDSR